MTKKETNSDTRHATMADIAAEVGVSRQLVGIALNGGPGVSAETQAKILTAAKEMGYRPNLAAQALRRDGSKYIGVVFHTEHSSTNELIPAIYKEAQRLGYQIVLSAVSHDRDESEAIDEVFGHRCDGLILVSTSLATLKLKNLATTIPLVSISRRLTGVRCGVVASKGESGVFDAVEYLVGLGHKAIAYIDPREMLDHEFRLEGYKTAMDKAKLKPQVINIQGDFVEAAGALASEKLLALPKLPTAVICANDQLAFGLVHCLLKAGFKIPQDISVVGYDDTVAKLPFLDLTTIRQDPVELAKFAVEDLSDRIRGKKYLSDTVLTSSKLVIRSSTSKPRSVGTDTSFKK